LMQPHRIVELHWRSVVAPPVTVDGSVAPCVQSIPGSASTRSLRSDLLVDAHGSAKDAARSAREMPLALDLRYTQASRAPRGSVTISAPGTVVESRVELTPFLAALTGGEARASESKSDSQLEPVTSQESML
jgi:hypothetical protein